MSTLYVVGTPIGNLGDITFRAIEVLKSVDCILCEDTRTTKILLDKYGIATATLSYHSHSPTDKAEMVFAMLGEGKNLALVSDAGTPAISDPGSLLVSQVRERFEDKVKIVAVPGPSALISALSISGLTGNQFTFFGFLPHKKGRESLFKEIADSKRPSVFYESPHRILKTLESLSKYAPDKKVTIARELTKIYEEVVSGAPSELLKFFGNNPDKARGEFVVIVGGE